MMRPFTVCLITGAVLILVMMLSLAIGRFPVAPGKVVQILVSQVFEITPSWTELEARIVTLVRGPRVVLVALCGAGLALCGAAMQGVFRNPLASPQILGVSSGASFGGALAILLGFSGMVMIGMAFGAAMLALIIVALLSRIDGRSENTTVILSGIVVGAFFAALVSLTQLLADPESSLQAIVFWLMGSFVTTTWERVGLAAPVILAGGAVLWLMRFRINVLSLGDAEARSLGVSPERDRWLAFTTVALIVGATVSVAGVIGWVGLVVPHAARLLVGEDHRHLMPASCLMGAVFLSLVDLAARSMTAAEIPLGVLTALIGAPVVAVLLRRMQAAAGRLS